MTVEAWLDAVLADLDRRQLPEMRPLIQALAQATRSLRAAEFNCDPVGSWSRVSNLPKNDPMTR
jgi:hypothetical protein